VRAASSIAGPRRPAWRAAARHSNWRAESARRHPEAGDIVSASAQQIGLNLYAARDTHIFPVTTITSTALDGLVLANYNSS